MSQLDLLECAEAFATASGFPGVPLAAHLASVYLDTIHSQVRARIGSTNGAAACRFELAAGAGAGAGVPAGNAWRPECGLVIHALQHGQTMRAAAQMALALAATGKQIAFAGCIEQPARLFIDGHLFEVMGQTSILAEGDEIQIEANGARPALRFSLDAGRWRATLDSLATGEMIVAPLDALASVRSPIYTIAAPPHDVEINDFGAMCESLPKPTMTDSIDQTAWPPALAGLNFVETFAPAYAAWNRPVSSGVLLQRQAVNGMAQSGSAISRPGLISLSVGAPAFIEGELFVHEHAHQHLMLYETFVPLTDKTVTTQFFSPIKRRRRDARRALLALHAIGNMLLYYREASRHGADLAGAKRRIEQYLGWFNQMKMELTGSTALTEAGHGLLFSLASAVEAAGVCDAI